MSSRDEFLRRIWVEEIDFYRDTETIDNIIANTRRFPDAAFGSVGPSLERMLARGVDKADLANFARYVSYGAVFTVLRNLTNDPVESPDDKGLHDDLLMADPSGREGR